MTEKIKKLWKEHKVPCIVAIVVIVAIILLLLMLGNGNANTPTGNDTQSSVEVSTESEVVSDSKTEENTEDYLAGIGTAPEDNSEGNDSKPNKEDAVVVPGEESEDTEDTNDSEGNKNDDKDDSNKPSDEKEDESDKKDEDSKDDGKKDEDDKKDEESNKPSEPEKPVHTCNFATLKTDANNHWYACSCGNTSGKGGHGYDDEYDASCNTCGYTRSVPERPAPPSDEKESIKFTGGTITLPTTGVTIPTLPHFNTAGMQPGGDAWWTGQEGDGNAQAGMNSIYNTCEQFTQKMRELDKGSDVSKFNASRNLIEWSWLGAGNDLVHQRS